MTPKLRKAHRLIWYSLAVLLPAGWIAAVLAIPDTVNGTLVRPAEPAPLPVRVLTVQSGDFVVSLHNDDSGTRGQIEVFITKPQTNPNTVLSIAAADNVAGRDLGLLGTRGVRRFDLHSLEMQVRTLVLRFEDHIQGRLLRSIPIKIEKH